MDDILLLGTNAKMMHMAVKRIIEYARDEMGLEIKPTWNVKKISEMDFIDTMGFRIYNDHVTMRRRIFLRVRRAYKKPIRYRKPTLKQAQKCTSYYGCIKSTNSQKLVRKYHIDKTVKLSKEVISRESKLRYRATKSEYSRR